MKLAVSGLSDKKVSVAAVWPVNLRPYYSSQVTAPP